MNRASFLDELLKLASDVNTIDIPQGMMSSDPVPESLPVRPADASTRRPETAHLPSVVGQGEIGGVTQAKDPIDRFKYNRLYRDRR